MSSSMMHVFHVGDTLWNLCAS